jgi:ATP-dependent 26S proteasome regulatory subunit
MSPPRKRPGVLQVLADDSCPIEHRKELLGRLCADDSAESLAVIAALLKALAAADGESQAAKKTEELSNLIQELKSGPLRCANFMEYLPAVGRARLVMEDGSEVYAVVPDPDVLAGLERGSRVLMDGAGKAILFANTGSVDTGEVWEFARRIEGTDTIELTNRGEEKMIFRAVAPLREKVENDGEVAPGSQVLACARRRLAFNVVPRTDRQSYFAYLDRQPVPDVRAERDIGGAPRYIEDLARHVRLEMTRPDLARRYRLPRSRTYLLEGITGSGKTLSICAFWRKMYEIASEVTGVPIEELPYRVTRLRAADFLSKWLGESDKRLDRFFTENEQLADEKFVAPDGTEYLLPVLAIIEECDGMARARGEDAVYDRIMTTGLQRLDPARSALRDRLVIYIATTNVVGQVDSAFVRRIGGVVVHFGHLTRRQFVAVLRKRLRDLPVAAVNGSGDGPQALDRLVSDVVAWMFSPNGVDHGQVRLSVANAAEPLIKFRRDFVTGAVVDRAVQQASDEACSAEYEGCGSAGLTVERLIACFDSQIRSLCDQLTPFNVGSYVALPEGARVTAVQRIAQPAVSPFELQRA